MRRDGPVAGLDPAYFEAAMTIDLKGSLLATRTALPYMPDGTAIVNIASISGMTGDFRGTLYGMSKAGVIALTKYTATPIRPPRHPLQRRRTRPYPHQGRHRQSSRRCPRHIRLADSAAISRQPRRRGRHRGLPCLRRFPLHHRTDHRGRRRHDLPQPHRPRPSKTIKPQNNLPFIRFIANFAGRNASLRLAPIA